MKKPKSLFAVDIIEERLARDILFRPDPERPSFLASTQLLAQRNNTSVSTVREALQRLTALGLVQSNYRRGPELPGLHVAVSGDSLPLEVRAASTSEERAVALQHFANAATFLVSTALPLVLGRDEPLRRRIRVDLGRLVDFLKEGAPYEKCAAQQILVCWVAGACSGEIVLKWAGCALYRSQASIRPWLERAIEHAPDFENWSRVLEAFYVEDRERVRAEAYHAIVNYCVRLQALASHDSSEVARLRRDPNEVIPDMPF